MRSLFLTALRTARSGRALPRRERIDAARAVFWLLAIRLLLRVVPYAALHGAIRRLPVRRPRATLTASTCARAIARGGRVVPRTTCLARALAAECLLRRDGHTPTLSLGVMLDETRRLHAHAWLESQGILVTGGDEAAGYRTLAPPSTS